MTPEEILKHVRQLIAEHSGGDPDRWFYANRYVFARLQLDEKKTKTNIKRQLFEEGVSCPECGKAFQSRRDVNIHRLDGKKGYSRANCVLMHSGCHRDLHTRLETQGTDEADPGVLVRTSKTYSDKPFLCWWDITPNAAARLDDYEAVEFVKKDSGERCAVPVNELRPFLVPDRQTSRNGRWAIKILKERLDELAFEPGRGGGKWLFLPVTWLGPEDDD